MTKSLPVLMITISVGASVWYACEHDWRHAIYWVAAAVITAAVTF